LQDSLSWNEKIPENGVLRKNGEIFLENYDFEREDFESYEDYKTFVEKTWKGDVRKLKTGIKISGETLANTRVKIISSQGKTFSLTSDNN